MLDINNRTIFGRTPGGQADNLPIFIGRTSGPLNDNRYCIVFSARQAPDIQVQEQAINHYLP